MGKLLWILEIPKEYTLYSLSYPHPSHPAHQNLFHHPVLKHQVRFFRYIPRQNELRIVSRPLVVHLIPLERFDFLAVFDDPTVYCACRREVFYELLPLFHRISIGEPGSKLSANHGNVLLIDLLSIKFYSILHGQENLLFLFILCAT